ncbi:competence protein [Virgibacillus dakarensis]|uniref:Competence protein n=1 Tax=Lentibacillus populi TaxID=1827502 RepID=A0A9W5X6H7_9BACI|nr:MULTISPECIES: competence protein ComK [Bacillaceae]MBT2216524.1 competence protein ComK [Virgibacillus dakarensis]MTW87606.1 competence protein [Virgibacillus dakarensis]GGB52056.1 hypothetical protein GCM10011409_32080 [Lentibacillus populi]
MGVVVNSPIYVITPQTKAILQKNSAYYRSRVLEIGRERSSIYRPEHILNHNCTINGATLSGRRAAVKHILKACSKLPIPVIPCKDVYMLPTASIKSRDCVWLSYYHVHYYEQRDNKTYVAFRDGSGLYVNASENAVDMQFKKASQVIAQMKRPTFQNVIG